jgi:RNA recognition motif-containing protein
MNLYAGNLSKDVTVEDLRAVFQPYGHVGEIKIIKDHFSNLSRGFAFVEMPENSEAKAAIAALHGKDFKGKPMVVNEARSRSEDRSRDKH